MADDEVLAARAQERERRASARAGSARERARIARQEAEQAPTPEVRARRESEVALHERAAEFQRHAAAVQGAHAREHGD